MKYLFDPFLPSLFNFTKKMLSVPVFAMILPVLCTPVFAEDEGLDQDNALPEIIVTATRFEEEVKDVPANVTVITEEDIESSTAQNIPDLLRGYAGVKVSDVMGSRRNFTVDLRGFGESASSNTLVLVDGRRVNQVDLSGTDWSQIPLDTVERIEVIRGGSGSVLYGDNAPGGVVNIITKAGDELKAGVEVNLGTYNTQKYSGHVSGSVESLSYSASLRSYQSDGYRENSDTESMDMGLNLDYYFGDLGKVHFSTFYHTDDTGMPGALRESDFDAGAERTDSVNPDDFSEVKDYSFKITPEVFFWNNSSFKIAGSQRRRETSFFSSFFGGEFTGDTEIKTTALSPQLVLYVGSGSMTNKLTVGYDYQKDEENIVNEIDFMGFKSEDDFEFEKESQGLYLHDVFSPVDNLSVSAGYRSDKADYEFESSASDDDHSVDESAYTFGINYSYYGKSYVYASYAKSYRYPLIDEFFSYSTNTVNTDLDEQKSDDYEIGARQYLADSSYIHVNYFRIDTEDEIFYDPIAFSNDNLDGETRREGVEVSFLADLATWIDINASYTYMEAKIEDGQFDGKDIPDVPNHKATLGTTLFWEGASFALNGYYVGERPFISDYNNDFSDQDDYIVINTRLKYKWKKLTAFFDINNLTNEQYSEYGVLSLFSMPVEKAYYPSPERHYLFGVSFDL